MKFKKLISLLILITFILNIAAQSSYSSIAVSLPAEYNLNKSFASNLYGSGNGNIVFLVQDLHCHYGTQNEIALFLKNISENENFNKIYVEGLSKDINGNFIKNLPEDIKNPLIENLFKEGRISGAEYFFLNSTKDMPLYALEDEKLYSDNGQRLEYILNTQKEAGKIISAMEKEIKSLRREKLTNANKKIFSALLKYENGKISQNNYYKYLCKCLQNVEKTARGGVSNLKTSDYAHIKEFINLPDKINYKQAQKELQAYLNAAKNILPYSAYSELVKNNEIYENLSKINKDYNIDMKKYAELEKSVRAYEYAKNADMLKLYNEEESLVNEILIKNASNSEIETIILSLAFEKFKRFMTNNATDSDYKYLAEFGLDYFGELWNKNIESETFEKISGYIEIYNAYYDANNRRNIEFANRIISGIDVRKTQSMTVAITGGFHTEELKELLLEKNIDVAVLTPKISGGIKEAEKKYKKLFGEQVQAETIGAAINAYALRSYLNSPGKQTELISALSDVNRLYKDKAFGNLTLEEVFRQIIDKYNNIEDIKENPSNTVSVIEVKNNKKGFSAVLTFKDKTHTITINQNGDVAVSGQTISGKDTKLKPGSLLNDRFKNKDSRLYKAYT
ncbi:MAG: hypothetical protein FWG51_04345, partial [Firmicutes bacterium]|nr:hypothetical protein [Bacillota bacterium]